MKVMIAVCPCRFIKCVACLECAFFEFGHRALLLAFKAAITETQDVCYTLRLASRREGFFGSEQGLASQIEIRICSLPSLFACRVFEVAIGILGSASGL